MKKGKHIGRLRRLSKCVASFSLALAMFLGFMPETALVRAETASDDFSTESTSLNEMDFDLPDFDDNEFESTSTPAPAFDDDFDTTTTTASASSSAMDFSDLYDEETIAGEHSTMYDDDEEDDTKKKTRVPVIICIVCAIICIIATLLVLFVIPSKYNWNKHQKTTDNSEWVSPIEEIPLNVTPVPQEPVEQPDENVPSPVAPEAEEDKIIVAPQPELVVPVPAPAPAEKPRTTGDIRYRIKWGDTLWDISEAYYKNPWRYPRIARYNNIKNPDLIISGTDILIPEE